MKETFLHYIWQYKLFTAHSLQTTDHQAVEVLDVGILNTDAGPDFFNAKIRIDDTIWAGNVEIHLNASDWKKHNHQQDVSYDNVILHVVQLADAEVYRTDGEKIPQLILTYPHWIAQNYQLLLQTQQWIPCAEKLATVPTIVLESWKTTLLTERIQQKTDAIANLLATNSNHWEEAFYITLSRNFGFGVNNLAFEMLAKSVSLAILSKHKDNLLQLEALLLGQAGLLANAPTDDYVTLLQQEYQFLKAKYQLVTIESSMWKMLRLRPDNFPALRIAQFAALIHHSSKLFSKILENLSINYLHPLFACEPSEYWKTHYSLGLTSPSSSKKLGVLSINTILINTVVPCVFYYAHKKNDINLKDVALQLLEAIPPEKNTIITHWQALGLKSSSAFDSQALLQLKLNYCNLKKCLQCRVGHKILTLPA